MFKTAYQLSRGAWFPKKTAFGKDWFFNKFGTGANFFLMTQGKFSSAQWKVQSTCSQKHSEEKMFSFLTQTYFSGLGTLTEAFLELSDKNNFLSFVENCIQRIRRILLMKILLFRNLELFNQFRSLKKESRDFFWITSERLSKLYLRVQATFGGKNLFLKCAIFRCILCILIHLSFFLSEFHWLGFRSWTPFARGSIGGSTFSVSIFFFELFSRFRFWEK